MAKYLFQPCRTKAYGEDIWWGMVFQRHMTGLTYEQIAANLNVDTSTVYGTLKQFDEEGTSEIVVQKQHWVAHSTDCFGESFSLFAQDTAPCCRSHHNGNWWIDYLSLFASPKFSRKKLSKIACQRSERLREKFMIDCYAYTPEMLIFVDETGCEKRNTQRKFAYSLRGNQNWFTEHGMISLPMQVNRLGIHSYCMEESVYQQLVLWELRNGVIDVYTCTGSLVASVHRLAISRFLNPPLGIAVFFNVPHWKVMWMRHSLGSLALASLALQLETQTLQIHHAKCEKHDHYVSLGWLARPSSCTVASGKRLGNSVLYLEPTCLLIS